MKTYSKIIAAAACVLSLSAYADGYRVVELGGGSPSDIPWVRIVTNQTDWEDLARESYATDGMSPVVLCGDTPMGIDCMEPPPAVDFETEQVVVGGLGLQPDSGHTMVVSNVFASESSGYQYVGVTDIVPGSGCATLPVVTNPMIAIVVEKTGLPLRLGFSIATTNCEILTLDL
ncbi:MAG: hypothetical protein AB2740_11870 [Candidatus Thiodiazotropha sp.]